jgi:transposase
VVAFEAGYDGFWLARWLRARGIEAYVIHPTSIPVSREQRRAKTDRLDTARHEASRERRASAMPRRQRSEVAVTRQ